MEHKIINHKSNVSVTVGTTVFQVQDFRWL